MNNVEVFLALVQVMGDDNGCYFRTTPAQCEAALVPIDQLMSAGFFNDDPEDIDSSFWMAAAGEWTEALDYFANESAAYTALSDILNDIYENGDTL